MDALTINEAAETTGWSPRMLRYIERTGLVRAGRSEAGYRLYRGAELERLRTLRELLGRFEISLTDVAFAARLDADPALRETVQTWLETGNGGVDAVGWLGCPGTVQPVLLACASYQPA